MPQAPYPFDFLCPPLFTAQEIPGVQRPISISQPIWWHWLTTAWVADIPYYKLELGTHHPYNRRMREHAAAYRTGRLDEFNAKELRAAIKLEDDPEELEFKRQLLRSYNKIIARRRHKPKTKKQRQEQAKLDRIIKNRKIKIEYDD